MTIFDERERGEETKFKHELELGFKIRNQRNKLFGLWLAGTHLGLSGEAATAYAKDMVMAAFDPPRGADVLKKAKRDLEQAGKQVSDHMLDRQLSQFEAEARQKVMAA